jgi:polyisoprenyl-phosphate glycosyltransferase
MQPVLTPRYSLVVPVYRNEGSIAELLQAIGAVAQGLEHPFEALFVVDGSPDASLARLLELAPRAGFESTVIRLSRNFGAFAAIREGLVHARGEFVAVMAADLQEPPALVSEFFRVLEGGDVDVVFGVRESRADPWPSRLASAAFWGLYRRFVQPDVPRGGVDVFALNRLMRERLIALDEANSSLLGLLFWLGGRRRFVGYPRLARQHGKSGWTLRKKVTYLLDSVFAFTDAPVRLLMLVGMLGLGVAAVLGASVLVARLGNWVPVPGYAGTMVTILFFGGLNAFGLGLVGNYAWRAYENTKRRPLSIALAIERFPAPPSVSEPKP